MANDRRMIDANYFVNKVIRNCPIEEGGIPLGDFAKHQKILELYPTVDAVEVVRCGKCKKRPKDVEWGMCHVLCRQTHKDDFCSYGERRNNE